MNSSETSQPGNGRDYEAEAADDGWLPKEQWKGTPEKWVDAKTFVERGESFLPIVNARLRKERAKTETLERKVDELLQGNREFRQFHEQALADQKRQAEARIEALQSQRAQAITDGDGPKAVRLESEIRQVEAQHAQVSVPPPLHPETQAWLNDNPWYNEDRALRAIADGLADVVREENPSLKGRAYLDKLVERVKAEVPHKFQQGSPPPVSTVDVGKKPAPHGRAKGYDDLPPEAKQACERFIKTIPGFTRDAYLSQYVWE